MNDVGMLIDVSHSGDRTTLDAIELSPKPIAITHSNCRALNNHPRLKTDEAIRKLAAKGGVMGITGVRMFVKDAEPTTIEHIVDHIDHVVKLVGIEHVGIGSDSDLMGYDHMPKDQYEKLKAGYKSSYAFRDKIDTDGFDHPRKVYDLTATLLKRGYSEANIQAVLGGNFRRLLGSDLARTKTHTATRSEETRGEKIMSTIFIPYTRLGHAILLALIASAGRTRKTRTKPDADNSATLGTIIVTAEKRSEDIQQVPMSIGVIDESQLENLHATQLADYAGYIPGFTVVNGGSPGQAMLGIRGITPLSAGSTVATYIDETPLGTSSNYGGGSTDVLDLLPYDFQSVEVLRGPQGTLYGAVALGGVLRYVTKQPDLDQLSWRVGADAFTTEGGSDAGFGGRFGFNAPIVAGQLALSASFARQDSPGYIDNVRTGEKDQDSFSQQAAHAQLLWQASDDAVDQAAGDPVEDRFRQQLGRGARSDLAEADLRRPQERQLRPGAVTRRTSTTTTRPSTGTSASPTSSRRRATPRRTQHSVLDASLVYGVAFPLFGLPAPGHLGRQLRPQAVQDDAGIPPDLEERRSRSNGCSARSIPTRTASRTRPRARSSSTGSSIPGLDPLAVIALPSTYKEYAFFGDLTYKFNTTFDVTGGLRYAHNEQTFSQISSGALLGGQHHGNRRLVRGRADLVVLAAHAPDAGPDAVRAHRDRLPAGRSERRAAGRAAVGRRLDADQLRDRLEGDVRRQPLDDRRRRISTSNGTRSRCRRTRTAWPTSRTAARRAAAASNSRRCTRRLPGLRLGLNGAYTDAKLTEDVPSLGGLNGDRLPAVPKWATSATADWSFPVCADWTGRIGGGIRYRRRYVQRRAERRDVRYRRTAIPRSTSTPTFRTIAGRCASTSRT